LRTPKGEFVIRPAEVGDAEALIETIVAAFEGYRAFAPPTWDPPDESQQLERFRAEIARPDVLTVMAEGAGHVHVVPRDEYLHFRHLFLRPPYWGTGLAVALHDAAVDYMAGRPARLYTPALHGRARRFYEREGWTLFDERHDEHFGMPLAEYRR
jgi:GNAT superfamily N-acetyltransferase